MQDFRPHAGITQYSVVADRRFRTCLVAVIGKQDFLHIPLQHTGLPGRKTRPERGHRLCESCLMHRNDIHVSFAENETVCPALPCKIQRIQILALVEYLCLRRIQIFRLSVAHHASAKTDDTVLDVHDREDDAVPELIVKPVLFIKGSHSRLQNHRIIKSFLPKVLYKIRIAPVRITEAEIVHRLRRKLPVREIG